MLYRNVADMTLREKMLIVVNVMYNVTYAMHLYYEDAWLTELGNQWC